MQKFISELKRLYLPAHALPPEVLAQHLQGQLTVATSLATEDGKTRAIVIAFPMVAEAEEGLHWRRLCELANVLQTRFGLPAPAVSISGSDAFGLWLSLATPTPLAQVQKFLQLLYQACLPDLALDADAASAPVTLPPCLHQSSGKWAAFIHPGLGASFADEPGLDMAPPFAGQTAFLEQLRSISEAQFAHALQLLEPAPSVPSAAPQVAAAAPHDLLLRDATLEDIVRFLHAKNIEPTFRHLIPPG